MNQPLDPQALDTLFIEARTHNAWIDKPVSDETLHQIYDLMKWSPTSANCSPARILFLRTPEAKLRLKPALSPGNIEKTMLAPITAIVAYDPAFYDKLPKLFPNNPGMRDVFANNPELSAVSAMRNSTLQGGYFILAARALGLDCGPMSGFDNAKVDDEFFSAPGFGSEDAGSSTARFKSNFLCNLGYGDSSVLFPRNPRLDFLEACRIL